MSASDIVTLVGGLLQIGAVLVLALQARAALAYFYPDMDPLPTAVAKRLRQILRRPKHQTILAGSIDAAVTLSADLSIRVGRDESTMTTEQRLERHSVWLTELDGTVAALRTEVTAVEAKSVARDAELRQHAAEEVEVLRKDVTQNILGSPRAAKLWFVGPMALILGVAFATWPDWFAKPFTK